jgi:hypothetical protein
MARICVSASSGWTLRMQLERNAFTIQGSQAAHLVREWKDSSRPPMDGDL